MEDDVVPLERKREELHKLHNAIERLHRFLNTTVRQDDDGNRIDEPFVVDLGFDLEFGGLQSAFLYLTLAHRVADVNLCFVNATTNLNLAPFPLEADRSVDSFRSHLNYIQHECKENAESLRAFNNETSFSSIDIDQQISDCVSTFHTFGFIQNYTDIFANGTTTINEEVVDVFRMESAHIRSSVVSPLNPLRDVAKSMLRSTTRVFMNNETDAIEPLYHIYNPNPEMSSSVVVPYSFTSLSPTTNSILFPTLNSQVLKRTFHINNPSVRIGSLRGYVQLVKNIHDKEKQLPHTPASSSATQAICVILSSLFTRFVERRMKKFGKDLQLELILPTKQGKQLAVIKNAKKTPFAKLDEIAYVVAGLNSDDPLMSVFKLYEDVVREKKPLSHPSVLPNILQLAGVVDKDDAFLTGLLLAFLKHYEVRVPIPQNLAKKLQESRII